ncbi:hypothetical protein DSLASN_18840 [Desulfoluna limicola]|uniref:Uncharacterized protein n=1 Tax=Desulfoluna limicola TaxID=2810562 RepID=A0ABN6F182_9BACT|nr:hypothetical protein DSLASN_18840 [Desulfoluna limicola]
MVGFHPDGRFLKKARKNVPVISPFAAQPGGAERKKGMLARYDGYSGKTNAFE